MNTSSVAPQRFDNGRIGGLERAQFRQREHCIACGSQNLKTIWTSSFDDPLVRGKISTTFYDGDPLSTLDGLSFRRSRCCDCSTTFQSDILTDEWLKVLYGQWVSVAQVDALESSQSQSAFWQAQENVRHCLRLQKMLRHEPVRVLDFGCGDGQFLRAANLFGFDCVGIDFSESRQTRNRHKGAVRLYSDLDELARSPDGSYFDAATLFQVLEHVAEPLAVLKNMYRWLKPGGILIVEVPDARGVGDVPMTMEEMSYVDPLEHINQFTPESLSFIGRQAGFEPIAPASAYVASRSTGVAKEVLKGMVWRSPLNALRKSTDQYFRKV